MSKKMDDLLEKTGWKEWNVHRFESFNRQWFKQVETKTPCQCNKEKDGIQLQVTLYKFRQHESYELILHAETKTVGWLRMSVDVEPENLVRRGVKLIKLWEIANEGGIEEEE